MADPRQHNLTGTTVGALKWTYLAVAVTAGMQLVFTAIMGRLLTPDAFGLVAMAVVALNLGQHFAQLGVGQAIIQKSAVTTEEIRASFTSSTGLGLLFAALAYLVAEPIASLFGDRALIPVFRAMGVTLLMTGVGITAESLLRRQLRFRELAYRDMLSYAIGYLGVGIGLAVADFGVWSLVAAAVTQSAIKSVVCYITVLHDVRPIFRWRAYRPLYSFGTRTSVIQILEYFGENLDVLAVGRYATAALLGNYNRAFVLVNLPLRQLMTGLSKVLFPSFSQIQNDVPRLRRAYLSGAGAAAGLLVPLVSGIGVAANEIVQVILGPQWEPAITVLPLVAVAGALHVMTHFSGVACSARAELSKKMVLQVCYVMVLGLLLFLAMGSGLWAYAAAFAMAQLFRQAGYMYVMNRVLGIRSAEFRSIYGRAVIAGAITAVVIFFARLAMVALSMPVVFVLAVEVLLGAVSLVALLRYGVLRPLARDVLIRLHHARGQPQGTLPYRVVYAVLGGR